MNLASVMASIRRGTFRFGFAFATLHPYNPIGRKLTYKINLLFYHANTMPMGL